MGKYIYDAVLTPEEEGGYSVDVPALPGCFTCGDDYRDAVFMAADAIRTWRLPGALADGRCDPLNERADEPEGCERVSVFVEADESYIVDGPVVLGPPRRPASSASRGASPT